MAFLPGYPRIVRADHGTENCGVATIHVAFRLDHDDCLSGSKSFIYGPSTANTVRNISEYYCVFVMEFTILQRIEAWWSQLRRFKTSWWIDMCKVGLLCNTTVTYY